MAIRLYELLGADDRRFSPYCWRTRMALAHKGLAAEIVPCKYTDKAAFAFSGQDRVPVIADGETVVSDSWNIACYLEDAYPDRPSLFGGEVGRGEARFFNEWIFLGSRPLLMSLVKDIHDHAHPDDLDYFRRSREERFGKTLEEIHAQRDGLRPAIEAFLAPLREVLKHQPFFCGASPAYADYIVFGTFQWARSVSTYLALETDDPLYGWRGRMLDLHDGLGRTVNAYPE
jgi:glutathione S-transferase